MWIAPARKGEGDEELVVDTDGALILGEGRSGDELIDHTKGHFGPAPGSTWHKWVCQCLFRGIPLSLIPELLS